MEKTDRTDVQQKSALFGRMIRFAGFFGIWIVLNGADLLGLLIGLVASAGVTWLSFQLIPFSHHRIKHRALAVQTCHFLWSSVVAGVDVALRAFYPRVRVNPGFVVCPCRLPEGASRDVFLAISSLVPGSLPAGIEEGRVIIHCLDISQPVAAQMAENEKLFMKVIGKEPGDD